MQLFRQSVPTLHSSPRSLVLRGNTYLSPEEVRSSRPAYSKLHALGLNRLFPFQHAATILPYPPGYGREDRSTGW
jgi:hypothetical protein